MKTPGPKLLAVIAFAQLVIVLIGFAAFGALGYLLYSVAHYGGVVR